VHYVLIRKLIFKYKYYFNHKIKTYNIRHQTCLQNIILKFRISVCYSDSGAHNYTFFLKLESWRVELRNLYYITFFFVDFDLNIIFHIKPWKNKNKKFKLFFNSA